MVLAERSPRREKKRTVRTSIPGKLILSGEHSVVYGEPALITTLDRYCQVTIVRSEEPTIGIEPKGFTDQRSYSSQEVTEFTERSRELWEQFLQTKDKKFLQEIHREPLSVVLVAIGETLSFLGKKDVGMKVEIHSSIPPGSGLGSSAAIAVGIIKGVLELLDKDVNPEELNSIAYEVEKRQHGLPSGGDNSAVVFGGFLRFRKIDEKFKIEQIRGIQSEQLPPFLLLQSGQPAESTGEMVALVRGKYERDQSGVGSILVNIGKVTTHFVDLLRSGKLGEFIPLIKTNEQLLEELGVVGERGQKVVRGVQALGGAAKICGAGGIKSGSGMILCLHEEPNALIEFAQENNLEYIFPVRLGVKGVTWERA